MDETVANLEMRGRSQYDSNAPFRKTDRNITTVVVALKQYFEEREGCYRIVGKRISLDSVVYAYRDGISPEGIVQLFPALTLEEVCGSIAFLQNHVAIQQRRLAQQKWEDRSNGLTQLQQANISSNDWAQRWRIERRLNLGLQFGILGGSHRRAVNGRSSIGNDFGSQHFFGAIGGWRQRHSRRNCTDPNRAS